ncbi:TonB-dependent receptor [Ramlibacter sp. MMS24-I3-19]|uniref:TonB-dependent receptor n=1 Tax=Ramlibacter sp. MMS24-I3-19 TaxID=3416606 RepID=UPI003D006090
MRSDTTVFRRTQVARAVITALCGTASLFIAQETLAQNQQNLQRVEVTGSNIKRSDSETASPVQVITRDQIERTGKTTIADVLLSLPFSNNGSVPLTFANGFAAGGSGVSMRGLGANATLVLINGRRIAPYGLADDGQRNFADLSSIPLDLVERVEVLKDGASAIYGSDALAGVVNIILRKEFNGFAASGTAGVSRYGDDKTRRASLTGGVTRGDFSGYLNLELSHQDELRQTDRTGKRSFIGQADLRSTLGYNPLTTGLTQTRGYAGSSPTATPSASPSGWARAADGPFGAATAGVPWAQLNGGNCVPARTPVPSVGRAGCLWNLFDYEDIIPKEDKVNLFGRGSLRLNGDHEAYIEAGVFNSKVNTRFTPSSVSSTWVNPATNGVVSNTNITMDPGHPDNPYPGSYSRLRYVTADLGGRNSEYNTTTSRFLAGLKGTVASWDYDTGLLYTESDTKVKQTGYIRNSVLQSALNDGTPYGYYRLGTNAGLNSPALLAALSPELDNKTKTSVTSIDARVSKELGKLSGGALGLAIGGELRQEKLNSPPVPFTNVGDIVGLGYSSFKQSRKVSAVFAELVAPVTRTVELSAAARYDRYSDSDSVVTPKVGIKWQALNPLLLRASYAEGFRAPGAAESGNSSVSAFTSTVDPVRCPGGNPLPGATPADCGTGTNTSVFSVGNKAIKPEKSQSWNLGFLLEPSRNFNVAVDFWQITRKNEIVGADAQAVLNNPTGYPGATIVRDPGTEIAGPGTGALLSVSAPYENGPKTVTNGFDIDMRVRQPDAMPNGVRLTGGMTLSFLNRFRRTLPDGTVLNYAGTYGPTALSSSAGMPRGRGSVDMTAAAGPWSVTGRLNYTSGIRVIESREDPTCLASDNNGDDFNTKCRVPAFVTFDLFGSYKLNKNLELTGSVLNVFDRVAAFDPQSNYGQTFYSPSYSLSGVVGRYYQVGVKYRFQ